MSASVASTSRRCFAGSGGRPTHRTMTYRSVRNQLTASPVVECAATRAEIRYLTDQYLKEHTMRIERFRAVAPVIAFVVAALFGAGCATPGPGRASLEPDTKLELLKAG